MTDQTATDLGPVIAHQHGDVIVEEGRARRRSPFALDAYRTRGQLDTSNRRLNELRWEAGNRLRDDVESAGLSPRVSARYAESVGSCHGTPQDHIASLRLDAYDRQRRAMDAVPAFSREAVWSVCVDGRPCGAFSMRALRAGLDGLISFYRLR